MKGSGLEQMYIDTQKEARLEESMEPEETNETTTEIDLKFVNQET